MSYQIQSKSDFSTGATLVVRVPEAEIDKKALYTVMADTPSFVLPFRFKNVDGCVEFTYLTGARNKLRYSYGVRSVREYAALWSSILNPLLECKDWFMNPFSFVLQADYMYHDRNSGTICYVYIPSSPGCSDTEALRQMAAELAEKCPASDPELEIKALRSIMQGFNPKEFLQMLQTFQKPAPSPPVVSAESYQKSRETEVSATAAAPAETPAIDRRIVKESAVKEAAPAVDPQPAGGAPDDIVINLRGGKEGGKKKRAGESGNDKSRGGGLFGGKSGKNADAGKAAEQPKPKSGGLFGKKKAEPQPVIMGAASDVFPAQPWPQKHSAAQPQDPNTDMDGEATQFMDDGATQLEGVGAKFRLVSGADLPSEIVVSETVGGPFIIGRFDISVGRRQADFEFDKSTRGVSRRHAAVERTADGYAIIDLSSSAGTFVNGRRLPPNVPHELTFGTRVSFGASGADYVFEG
ncbi:MAG: FHA domain-containing protein [Oscillospiraceae bacterium]|jgi:hypothetical protein|nr:FHA domain-containing protein [Oscillospiraceae bacterium]